MSALPPEQGAPDPDEGDDSHREALSLVEKDETVCYVKSTIAVGAVFALGALGLYGARAAYSVLVGGAIAVANLLVMRAIVRALVPVPKPGDPQRDLPDGDAGSAEPSKTAGSATIGWAIVAAVKLLALVGGLWFLLSRDVVDPMPLVVGYGALPFGIAIGAIVSSRRQTR